MKKIRAVIAIVNLIILFSPLLHSLHSEIPGESREISSRENPAADYPLVLKEGKVLRHFPVLTSQIFTVASELPDSA